MAGVCCHGFFLYVIGKDALICVIKSQMAQYRSERVQYR